MNMQNSKSHSSIDTVRKLAVRVFALELAKTELAIFKERQNWRNECKMAAYFQSTPEKAAYSRLMYVAARVNRPYRISEISKELGISHSS